tara:strand:- start:286 stop:615 length:330 start_codon:yes stop_codon:yes gene_type:complete
MGIVHAFSCLFICGMKDGDRPGFFPTTVTLIMDHDYIFDNECGEDYFKCTWEAHGHLERHNLKKACGPDYYPINIRGTPVDVKQWYIKHDKLDWKVMPSCRWDFNCVSI